jgi:hypothetical protein
LNQAVKRLLGGKARKYETASDRRNCIEESGYRSHEPPRDLDGSAFVRLAAGVASTIVRKSSDASLIREARTLRRAVMAGRSWLQPQTKAASPLQRCPLRRVKVGGKALAKIKTGSRFLSINARSTMSIETQQSHKKTMFVNDEC